MVRRGVYVMLMLAAVLCCRGTVSGQVSLCYDFDDYTYNGRPPGWYALPNLDYNYVGVSQYDPTAFSGAHALHVKGNVCHAIMPDDGLDYAGDSLWMHFEYYLSNNTVSIEVGYLTDINDSNTFHLLTTHHGWHSQWYEANVSLASVPAGARVAFRSRDIMADLGQFWIDNVYVTDAPCNVPYDGLRVTGNWADSVRVEWDVFGSPDVTVGSGSNTYYPTGNSITVPRYFPEASYSVFYAVLPFSFSSNGLESQYHSPCRSQGLFSYFKVPPYREASCVTVTDIFSSMALPYCGTPVDPYLEVDTRTTTAAGITGIYAGSHMLNYTVGSDVTTGQMVFPRCIPPGENVSMRLGNRLGDWESASMLYTITVDTAESDLLVVKYTIAMNDGIWISIGGGPAMEHADSVYPPKFRIELMDDTLGLLPSAACHRVALDGMSSLGWDALDERNNSYSRRNYCAHAFDLSPWHGQRVKLRITATDGCINNRWCYAYYTTECLKQYDIVGGCDVDSVTLTAPWGFRYQWWRDDTHVVADTARNITVATDGTMWHCDLIDLHAPECRRTISRMVIGGPHVAVRDTVVENQLPYTYRGHTFYGPVDTTLFISAASGCDTMLHYRLYVWNNHSVRLVSSYCPGEWPVVWNGHTFNGPDSVTFVLPDIHGADSVVTLVALELAAYEVYDSTTVCPGGSYTWGGVNYGGPVAFDTVVSTVEGCDSLVHVVLLPRDTAIHPHMMHSIDGDEWADTLPVVFCSNQTLQVVDSTYSAEAWLWSLGDGAVAEGRRASFDFAATDSVMFLTLTLVVMSGDGCSDTVTSPLVVVPSPVAAFAWDPEKPADIDPEVHLINYSVPDSCDWQWMVTRMDGGMDTLFDHSPSYRWTGDLPQGDYDVMLVASNTLPVLSLSHTCSDTVRHAVTIATSLLEFPNLVTPDGDGVNDIWRVVNLVELGQYTMNEVWIYNQWGVLVWHCRGISEMDDFWDPNHPFCPDGTYYFHFLSRSVWGVIRRNGVIEVLR